MNNFKILIKSSKISNSIMNERQVTPFLITAPDHTIRTVGLLAAYYTGLMEQGEPYEYAWNNPDTAEGLPRYIRFYKGPGPRGGSVKEHDQFVATTEPDVVVEAIGKITSGTYKIDVGSSVNGFLREHLRANFTRIFRSTMDIPQSNGG